MRMRHSECGYIEWILTCWMLLNVAKKNQPQDEHEVSFG